MRTLEEIDNDNKFPDDKRNQLLERIAIALEKIAGKDAKPKVEEIDTQDLTRIRREVYDTHR